MKRNGLESMKSHTSIQKKSCTKSHDIPRNIFICTNARNSYRNKKYGTSVRPSVAAFTIGAGYLTGGIITTLPYYFTGYPLDALKYSVFITLIILFVAGYWESRLNGWQKGWTNAVRVCLTGAAAATAANS